jgi:hypothetical protein
LYDYETIVDEHNRRLIGFGRYAGIVGAYNSIRAFGIKFELLQKQKHYLVRSFNYTFKTLGFTTIKICNYGNWKSRKWCQEILDAIKIKEVSVENY